MCFCSHHRGSVIKKVFFEQPKKKRKDSLVHLNFKETHFYDHIRILSYVSGIQKLSQVSEIDKGLRDCAKLWLWQRKRLRIGDALRQQYISKASGNILRIANEKRDNKVISYLVHDEQLR